MYYLPKREAFQKIKSDKVCELMSRITLEKSI